MSLVIGCLLLILYAYLFTLLQLEDNALLVGSIGLFALPAAAMFVIRNVDWYGLVMETPEEL